VTVAIVRQRSLFGVVILASVYSFLMASVLIVLDAVDVAMTEASVGAGISTVLLLATLHLIRTTEMRSIRAAPVRIGRHWRGPCLGHAPPPAVRHSGRADP
jgi:multicomponent Na+:H+ antiporter subunit B